MKRIAWYTKKVAELYAIHLTKREPKHQRRAERLAKYKAELNRRLRSDVN